MVEAENQRLETPLHEACRQGNVKIVMLLFNTNPWVACKLNYQNESPFFMACSNGHLKVVKLLLNQPWLRELEEDGIDQNCLHVAASRGHTGVVKKILDVCPNFAQKIDKNGQFPLHSASSKGHREITQMLLQLDSDIAVQFSNDGYTPLHLAAMNGKAAILEEFLSMAPTSFQYLTKQGETVFHLLVRYNHYDAFVYLVQVFADTYLFHCPDQYGNTILHLAAYGGRYQIVEYLIRRTTIEVNSRNLKGLTALDILKQAEGNAQILLFKLLQDKAKKTSEVEECNTNTSEEPESSLSRNKENLISNGLGLMRLSKGRRQELNEMAHSRQNKQHEMYSEALQNTRNTITVVAILVATVSFTAGVSPPGGVYQEGPHKGKSVAGKTTAFRVFLLSNNIALFTSLCIVVVLVSIIPFKRKAQMRLLVIAHKVLWVAVAFMATAYVAAVWVTMPHDHGRWVLVALLSTTGATLGTAFIGLTVMLVEHWLRKLKWRKEQQKRGKELEDLRMKRLGSFNSDMESSNLQGYHSY
ncbi:hypothetical protein COLO4_30481 [Corchorus olitorius]|uniref:PGG domain-containing protein n=1 Tax=Corchorus olitorius TaxID=93759 RepID=A0A1R3H8I0_9ROSI|nr:hypothetical protein COLO4_30481 [Corchorus olitorius]